LRLAWCFGASRLGLLVFLCIFFNQREFFPVFLLLVLNGFFLKILENIAEAPAVVPAFWPLFQSLPQR
jgi:hypothetical protein